MSDPYGYDGSSVNPDAFRAEPTIGEPPQLICVKCGERIYPDYGHCKKAGGIHKPAPSAAPSVSTEPPQSAREWLSDHLWRDKDKNEKIPVGEALMMPDNYPVLTTVGRFSESLDAYASECVKRERERCAGIAHEESKRYGWHSDGTKAAQNIRTAIERGEG